MGPLSFECQYSDLGAGEERLAGARCACLGECRLRKYKMGFWHMALILADERGPPNGGAVRAGSYHEVILVQPQPGQLRSGRRQNVSPGARTTNRNRRPRGWVVKPRLCVRRAGLAPSWNCSEPQGLPRVERESWEVVGV